MITKIGITAGDIWNFLDKNGSANLSTLVKKVGKPRDLLLMSLGWLSREGYVTLVPLGNDDYQANLLRR